MLVEGIDPGRVGLVAAWTIAMAVLGTVLAGSAVRTWYPTGVPAPRPV